jgi:DNA-binding cell septation regulator SpoVG
MRDPRIPVQASRFFIFQHLYPLSKGLYRMLQIKILGVSKGTKRYVLASVQIELTSEDGRDVVCVIDARVLRSKKGQVFVSYPQQTHKNFEGKIEYTPILKCSPDLQRRISDVVLAAYQSNLQMQPQPSKMTPKDFGSLSEGI